MKLPRTLALPLAAAAVITAGLTVGALAPSPGVGAPTPTASFVLPEPFLSAVTCEEDEPCWNCADMGNRICGTLTEADRAVAWAAWDRWQGWRQLRADASRGEVRVEVAGYSPVRPAADAGVAIEGADGRWFLFRAVYTDGV